MKLSSYNIFSLLLALNCVFGSTSAASASLIVSNTADTGAGSLRDAIVAAAAGDSVAFSIPTSDPGYDSASGVFTIILTSGEIVIDKDLTIAGPAAANVAISGNRASRIFRIASGTVLISNLTLRNGAVVGKSPSGDDLDFDGETARGGAVLNAGALTCTRCTFDGNSVTGGTGRSDFTKGGIGGDGTGGAIVNDKELSLFACTFTSNSAVGGAGGISGFGAGRGRRRSGIAAGGAVYNGEGATLALTNCTITNNTATTPNAERVNSGAFGGNGPADAFGGGIASRGTLSAVHSTVAANTAGGGVGTDGMPHAFAFGGGLYVGSGSASVRDSIFADNQILAQPPTDAGAGAGPDVNGAVTSEGHNLLGRSDGSSGFRADDLQGGTTEETRLDPRLGPLGDNGGPTQTLPLEEGSPAIGAADTSGPKRDQRGFLRNAQPDIGAFEYEGAAPAVLANISTRARVGTGDAAMIGGFIITGSQLKTLVIRAVGPSLGLAEALGDPTIEIYDGGGQLVAMNDNWVDAETRQQISDSGLAPADDREPALWGAINPGAYTVAVRGKNQSSGISLLEVYDLDRTVNSALGNISTRGFVQPGDRVMIGGFIVVSDEARKVIVRAIGPSVKVNGALADPMLELYDRNGVRIAANDNWRSDQEAEIVETTIPPSDDAESAIVRTLAPGAYTAIVRGADETSGIALVEVYSLD